MKPKPTMKITKEKQFIKEKQIKDGVKTLLDSNGNVVKDSIGNPIKVDNFKTISIIAHILVLKLFDCSKLLNHT